MEIKRCIKYSFCVIGKEGSTNDGDGFIEKLWKCANENVSEVENLAKKDENGNIIGIWGAMSDFSYDFKPWGNNFTQGLYLAGVEVKDDAEAPEGWVKWVVPSFEYLYVKVENKDTFVQMIEYMKNNNIDLVGAVQDYICTEENGQCYMFFPIKKL